MHRPVLNQEKRRAVIALINNGSSVRKAALYVGCAPTTITNTAKHDPHFAEQLAHASQNLEIDVLRSLRNAAKKERYWRAGAWLLERKNPEDFVIQPPDTVTPKQMHKLLDFLATEICDVLPARYRKLVIKRMNKIVRNTQQDTNANNVDNLFDHQPQKLPFDSPATSTNCSP